MNEIDVVVYTHSVQGLAEAIVNEVLDLKTIKIIGRADEKTAALAKMFCITRKWTTIIGTSCGPMSRVFRILAVITNFWK